MVGAANVVATYLSVDRSSPFARRLVGFWPTGNSQSWGSGKLIDLSGCDGHGTLSGFAPGSAFSHRMGRRGLIFDGSDDKVDCGDRSCWRFDRTTPFSIAFWAKKHTTTTQYLVHKYNGTGYTVSHEFSGGQHRIRVIMRVVGVGLIDVQTTSSPVLATDIWRHIGITYTGSSAASGVAVYQDGVAQSLTVNADTLSSGSFNVSDPLVFGSTGSGSYFNGIMDDMRFWEVALTADAVRRLYRETLDGSYGSLVQRPRRRRYVADDVATGIDVDVSPVVLTLTAATPTAEKNAGAAPVTLTTSPVSPASEKSAGLAPVAMTLVAVSSTSAKEFAASPVALALAVVGPTPEKSVPAGPVALTLSSVTPATAKSAAASPVQLVFALTIPQAGETIVNVSPVVISLGIPAPAMSKAAPVDPVSLGLALVGPTTIHAAAVSPVALTLSIVSPTVDAGLGGPVEALRGIVQQWIVGRGTVEPVESRSRLL